MSTSTAVVLEEWGCKNYEPEKNMTTSCIKEGLLKKKAIKVEVNICHRLHEVTAGPLARS